MIEDLLLFGIFLCLVEIGHILAKIRKAVEMFEMGIHTGVSGPTEIKPKEKS